jgi:7-carboxy-7-deazaguanine synthase
VLRLLEHYSSPQGEGPRVGIMSQFVRFAGCNLKCPGWPCDTQFAIDPKLFRTEQKMTPPGVLVDAITTEAANTGARNIVFTGGEPLLQGQDDLSTVLGYLDPDLKFEVFTNGTMAIHPYLVENCSFVMDWKLPGSGEDQFDVQRVKNVEVLNHPKNAIKFVITTRNDLLAARTLYEEFLRGSNIQVFVGAAWDKYSNEAIVEYVKTRQLPWRLNVQVQNYVFGPQRRAT